MQNTKSIGLEGAQATAALKPEKAIAETRLYRTWEELEILRPEWDELLLRNSASASIFSTPEWLGTWWKSYGGDQGLLAVAIHDSNFLVGLAPLYSRKLRSLLGSPLRILRFIGDGSLDSDNLTFITRTGYEECFVSRFLDWLGHQSGWDLCSLRSMPIDAPTVEHILRMVKQRGWPHAISLRPLSAIVLTRTWEQYLAKLSAKERSKIRYRRRRLETKYDVHFCRCSTLSDLPGCLEQLFVLHQKRWNERGKLGSFSSSRRREFYERMARSLLMRDYLELWLLDLGGKKVAAQLGLRYGDEMCSLQEGFDPEYASDSVGYVLRSYVLQRMIERGIRRYNFLAGKEESKERWGTVRGKYIDIDIARPSSRGARYLKFQQWVNSRKEWMCSRLPPGVVRAMQAARQRIRLPDWDDSELDA